jgi:GT2 family glycosyltransferase
MDEDYFLYYEEYDYCERAKRAGFAIYYNGTSHIVHKQSVSVGRLSPLKAYYMSRNRLLFSIKHFNGWQRSFSLLFFISIALPKKMLSEYLSGRGKNSIAAFQGVMDVWRKRSRPLYR